eukprot:573631-Rhodomonas_salina.1
MLERPRRFPVLCKREPFRVKVSEPVVLITVIQILGLAFKFTLAFVEPQPIVPAAPLLGLHEPARRQVLQRRLGRDQAETIFGMNWGNGAAVRCQC